MLSNAKMDKVSLYCHAMVGHMFATMHNPRMRGPKFTWENFPKMMADHCKTMIFIHFPNGTRGMDEIQKHAEKTGRQIAADMVKWMTEE